MIVLGLGASAQAAGTTASFLKIPVGARPVALRAFTAVAGDATALWWNPAGLASARRREVAASHAGFETGLRYEHLAYVQPAFHGALGLSAGSLNPGRLEGRDAQGNPTGAFAASDLAVGLSYGRALGAWSFGGTAKAVRSRIADVEARGWAADLGAQFPSGWEGVTLGLAVRNLGPGLRFERERSALPLTAAVGAAYAGPVTITAEAVRRVRDSRTDVSAGAELPVLASVALRAGWLTAPAATGAAGGQGFAAGLGLRVLGARLDYAFTPLGELGGAQRLTLSARF